MLTSYIGQQDCKEVTTFDKTAINYKLLPKPFFKNRSSHQLRAEYDLLITQVELYRSHQVLLHKLSSALNRFPLSCF
jgi:hypothetical protein